VAEVAVLEHERRRDRPEDLENGERAVGEVGLLARLAEAARETSKRLFEDPYECVGDRDRRPRERFQEVEDFGDVTRPVAAPDL
jgi:hypothetical protein